VTQPIRNVTGMPYGEAQAFVDQQQAAPLAQAQSPEPLPEPRQMPTPLSAGTEFPDEPVTAGAGAGDGPGPEALGPSATEVSLTSHRHYLAGLELMASQPNASPAARNYIRRLIAATPPD
jgi:hypothetical protein